MVLLYENGFSGWRQLSQTLLLTKLECVVFDKIHTCWQKSSYIFDYGGDDDSDTGGLWNLTLNYEG